MNDRARIQILICRLDELRSRDVPTWQLAIREVAIRVLEEELEHLSRRVEHRLREGLVA